MQALNTRLKARVARLWSANKLVKVASVKADAAGDQVAIAAVDDDGRPVYVAIGGYQMRQLARTLLYCQPVDVNDEVYVLGRAGKYLVREVRDTGLRIGAHGRVFVTPAPGTDGPTGWVPRAVIVSA